MIVRPTHEDRLQGTLLGTALGDALGLPAEGMSASAIARRFGRADRFRLLGRTGFVSDDTEQSALVAQSLLRGRGELVPSVRAFRWALLGWFLRLPWGIGLATLRACVRIALGLSRTGVRSAGNGAAMRAAIVGTYLADDPERRGALSEAFATVTHLDSRAVAGARFTADVAAGCTRSSSPAEALAEARAQVSEPELGEALMRAHVLAERGAPPEVAASTLGTSGFVMHTIPFAAYCFERFGDDPLRGLQEVVASGGDTDSIGAIVGAWAGALHGAAGLPPTLVERIQDGPFGPSHLRALGSALAALGAGRPPPRVSYSWFGALVRNLLLYPVVLAHGFRRLLP